MKFELDDDQLIRLNEWRVEIKNKFGRYGTYDYIFTPFGIGAAIKVVSHLTKTDLDLTDVGEW